MDDKELLREYAECDSETAFAEIVARHLNKVYSVAWRHTGNPHAAEEITQAVFVILATKAQRLNRRVILSGWLYETARLTALTYIRSEIRRTRREEAHMQSILNESESEIWPQIAPLLDEAMTKLNETDRHAVVLRFFDGKSMKEVGAALGANEDAAKKRVNRALEKLRKFFTKRGVVSTATIIAGAISANSVQAAPAALAKTATAVAIAKGAIASSSTIILVKGVLNLMTLAKAKTTALIGSAIILAAGATAVAVNESFWQMKLENLDKAPSVLIIRPAQYSDHMAMTATADNDDRITKVIAHNETIPDLIAFAYSFNRPRMILPPNMPTNQYEMMLTLTNHQYEALQEAIRHQFGFIAQRETLETNVFLLQVKHSAKLATHVSKTGSKLNIKQADDMRAWVNCPISYVTKFLENTFGKPVVTQSDLTKNYDIIFKWKDTHNKKDAMNNDLAQAGLELVPTNMPIEMLVVEKAR